MPPIRLVLRLEVVTKGDGVSVRTELDGPEACATANIKHPLQILGGCVGILLVQAQPDQVALKIWFVH